MNEENQVNQLMVFQSILKRVKKDSMCGKEITIVIDKDFVKHNETCKILEAKSPKYRWLTRPTIVHNLGRIDY
jgi:hypothetical protein